MKKLVIILVITAFLLGACTWHTPRGCPNCTETRIYDIEHKTKYIIKTSPSSGTTIYDKNRKKVGTIK